MVLAIVLLALFAVFASASPVVVSKAGANAQRLARGLPPLPPKFRVDDMSNPTPVYGQYPIPFSPFSLSHRAFFSAAKRNQPSSMVLAM
jgi:hypothetical protein